MFSQLLTLNRTIKKILRETAKQVMLLPPVKQRLEKLLRFYGIFALENVAGDITNRYSELYDAKLLDIGKEFPERDAKALETLVRSVLKDHMVVVEIGSWKGMSTAILARTVVDSSGSVFAVDHWMGSEGVAHHEVAKTTDIFSIFKYNLSALGLWDSVHPLVMDSETAAKIFADGILDLVFLDSDHRYESVKKDISSWLPKLRNGGILCGHDCEGYYSDYLEEEKKIIQEHPGDDYIHEIGHPGVIMALHEFFGKKYSIIPNSTMWYYVKKDTVSN